MSPSIHETWKNTELCYHKGEKEKLVVKGAEHAKAYAVAPEVYWNTIKNFIKKSKIL